ncbi:hypothetical protein BIFBIF_01479 [Bifidobacterium bifidum ATCC 29521 = JCM 1255 = DSM 20456]|nr:hypothetical protein BIFBIF_01479 [Bifidobacterium bifidum ATCC 29521 = JCM 1255 = DSM 20456]
MRKLGKTISMCYSHRSVAGCTVMDAIATLPSDIADEKIRHM